jgi:hypothetical protein
MSYARISRRSSRDVVWKTTLICFCAFTPPAGRSYEGGATPGAGTGVHSGPVVPQLLVFIIHVRSPPRALPGWDLFFGPQGRVRAGAYRVFTNPGDLHEHLGELGLSAVP